MKSAVFLDRDGVLNEAIIRDGKPYPPAQANDVKLLPQVRDACYTLKESGVLLIVITNQPDIARGITTQATVDLIHKRLLSQLPLDDICVCPHDDSDACHCRKPRPGLILDAAKSWGIDLGRSVMVGDRWRDHEAGTNAGCATIFIDHSYQEPRPSNPNHQASSLAEAVPWILRFLQKN